MKFPPFLHSHLRLTLLGTPPNRVFLLHKGAAQPDGMTEIDCRKIDSLVFAASTKACERIIRGRFDGK